jgi:hypothetical protein
VSADSDDGLAIGYKVLPRGTPVVFSDGVELGTVHRVRDNAREHIFDGIVVKTADGGKVFVDAPEVQRIAERRVTLSIPSTDTDLIQEHRGVRGSLERRAKRRMNRVKRRLPRRDGL